MNQFPNSDWNFLVSCEGILDDIISTSDMARRTFSVQQLRAQRYTSPQTIRPNVDARRIHPQSQGRTISHHHRA